MSATTTTTAGTGVRAFFTTEELADRYRTSPSSIRYWRMINTGPTGVKYGRRVLYTLESVEAWEAQQERSQSIGGHAA